jgi:hypothetical protein
MKLKVSKDGILSFKNFLHLPATTEGGIVFHDNNFYLGLG